MIELHGFTKGQSGGQRVLFSNEKLCRLHDQTGTNASGANTNPLNLTVSANMTNRLQIGVPQALRLVIGVAYIIANMRRFSTEFTYPAHDKTSFPSESIAK
jgi:hypothetical protein